MLSLCCAWGMDPAGFTEHISAAGAISPCCPEDTALLSPTLGLLLICHGVAHMGSHLEELKPSPLAVSLLHAPHVAEKKNK